MILPQDEWRRRAEEHAAAVDKRIVAHLDRRCRHEKHPVFDFLFDYYPVRPAHLRRWHPGVGISLSDPDHGAEHTAWRDYTRHGERVELDVAALWARRGESFCYIRDLLRRTALNAAKFDCFGLHEWAMVYRSETVRHDLPLRLSRSATDAVVEENRVTCTHFDAYRFFTTPARPLNLRVLTREAQPVHEQAGCVHATMDLYKWAAKLGPLVPGELFLATFDLATDARVLDMEASPYDCRDLGFGVVAVETPSGRAEYVRRQRNLAARARPLRDRLVGLIDEAERTTLSA